MAHLPAQSDLEEHFKCLISLYCVCEQAVCALTKEGCCGGGHKYIAGDRCTLSS